jgi:hypothetical protein
MAFAVPADFPAVNAPPHHALKDTRETDIKDQSKL